MQDWNKSNPHDERGFIVTSFSDIDPAQEARWDKAVLIAAVVLLTLGFFLSH